MADEYGRIADVSGGIDGTGGGVVGVLLGGELPAFPDGTPLVGVTDITGAMGPKLYQVDVSGNRTGVVAPPGS